MVGGRDCTMPEAPETEARRFDSPCYFLDLGDKGTRFAFFFFFEFRFIVPAKATRDEIDSR